MLTNDTRRCDDPAAPAQPDAAADTLWLAALAVEADDALTAEMALWDAAGGDGCDAAGQL